MEYAARAQILRQSLIFSSLTEDEAADLSKLTTERSFKSGEFVFWEGDKPDWFYVVAEGRIKVLKHSSSGKEFIIAFFDTGEMFGEVAVFENKPYPASARSVTNAKVLGIKQEDNFGDLTDNRPLWLHDS